MFHNSNFFGSCIIHILYTECAKIKKNNSGAKRLNCRIILLVVLYGCKTWSLTLREERRLRVSENSVLRRIFEPKRDEVRGGGENYIMKSLMICTPNPILLG